ncbi:MAG: YbaK/EbsC family protein [Candidatus Hydrogenedentota bacterium]|nr:MAG: YbaK/EbsC family protein [Candidatus Hydrogenedentota bacterium]
MTISKRLKEYLDANNVEYNVMTHKVAYTAQEVAAAQGVTGWQVAKSVVLNCDGDYMLVVLQAPALVDLARLKKAIGCKEAKLASESEMEKLFPGVELGAESPFGNLYNLTVYVDKGLTEMREIVFNAGSHTETIRLKYDDYARLVNPTVVDIGKPAKV